MPPVNGIVESMKMKVSQFGPMLLAAWQKAAEGKLKVATGTGEEGRKAAVHLRYRLYMLRAAMERESHPLHPLTLRARLTITTDKQGVHYVEGAQADKSLEDLLQQSGISLPDAPDLPDISN